MGEINSVLLDLKNAYIFGLGVMGICTVYPIFSKKNV